MKNTFALLFVLVSSLMTGNLAMANFTPPSSCGPMRFDLNNQKGTVSMLTADVFRQGAISQGLCEISRYADQPLYVCSVLAIRGRESYTISLTYNSGRWTASISDSSGAGRNYDCQ